MAGPVGDRVEKKVACRSSEQFGVGDHGRIEVASDVDCQSFVCVDEFIGDLFDCLEDRDALHLELWPILIELIKCDVSQKFFKQLVDFLELAEESIDLASPAARKRMRSKPLWQSLAKVMSLGGPFPSYDGMQQRSAWRSPTSNMHLKCLASTSEERFGSFHAATARLGTSGPAQNM